MLTVDKSEWRMLSVFLVIFLPFFSEFEIIVKVKLRKTKCQIIEVREEGDDRGWDGWMSSATWLTWAWASSGSWWWTGKPGMLQSMGPQRFRHDWATELNWNVRWINRDDIQTNNLKVIFLRK